MQADRRSIVVLRELLFGRGVAALATLHEGRPFASMVPFACADFSLVAIEPTLGRLVAGFARATTLAPETLVAAASHG